MNQRVLVSFVSILCLHTARSDLLTLDDGQTLRGRITFREPAVSRILSDDGPVEIPLARIRHAHLEPPPAPVEASELSTASLLANQYANRYVAIPSAGILTWNGSFIARSVDQIDDTRILLRNRDTNLLLTRINAAAIFFAPLSLHHAQRLRHAKPGLLLSNGDFIEGQLKSFENKTLTFASLIFGLRKFSTADDAVALLLHPPSAQDSRFTVQTGDGSRFLLPELRVEDDTLVADGSPFHRYPIPFSQGLVIRAEPGTNLLELAWARLDAVSESLRNDLLARIKIPDLVKEAAEANLVRARNIWDDARRVWTNKNREYDEAKKRRAAARAQAQAKQRQLANLKTALDRVTARLNRLTARGTTAEPTLQNARNALDRARNRCRSALHASRQADENLERVTQIEAEAKKALDQAQTETDKAKEAFDIAMARLL